LFYIVLIFFTTIDTQPLLNGMARKQQPNHVQHKHKARMHVFLCEVPAGSIGRIRNHDLMNPQKSKKSRDHSAAHKVMPTSNIFFATHLDWFHVDYVDFLKK